MFPKRVSDAGLEHIIQNIYSGSEYIMNFYKLVRKQAHLKMGKRLEKSFHQKEHTNG